MAEKIKNDQEIRREEEIKLLEEAGVNPYPYYFNKTHKNIFILNNFDDAKPEEFNDVNIAGRIMSIRRMGKASFVHIMDDTSKLQIYFRRDDLPEFYENLKKLDIGDIIGVNGYVFRTKTGEISVHAKSAELLCKSLTNLPIVKEEIDADGNKVIHDAFADKELRYRKRYIDLIVNAEVRETFIKRSKIISFIRKYFDAKG
ncbi:MAG: lysine--tRNA ligase, partial [Bacteroidetes bacterium]|nr:lysine--tRNA ligase [Bacteroidota bacterium]